MTGSEFAVVVRGSRWVLLALILLVAGCSSKSELSAFSSDGCSLFPDKSLIGEADWCLCCFEHDKAYWRGGTAEQREAADQKMRQCIVEKTGNKALASLMYEGVRAGGSPYFYNWYRWGYGWPYERKYQPLSPAEVKKADSLLAEYFASEPEQVCD